MLEFFVIFGKSGIVLFATANQSINQVLNGLIKHVFLEERTGQYQTDQLQIKYHLDNEFELVFVIGYQKFLQLSYVDKFLNDIQLAFRDKYSDFDLRKILNVSFNKQASKLLKLSQQENSANFSAKTSHKALKEQSRLEFCDLIVDEEASILDFTAEFGATYETCVKNSSSATKQDTGVMRTFHDSAKSKKTIASMKVQPVKVASKPVPPKVVEPAKPSKKAKKPPADMSKKGKAARQWELSGSNPDEFDFSKKDAGPAITKTIASETNLNVNLNISSSSESDSSDDEDTSSAVSAFGSVWRTISFNKTLTLEDLSPVLDQLREHLISKNVASSIADELCKSVGEKLQGLNVSTWVNLKKFACSALEETVLRILNPSKNINILREIQAKAKPPYVIVFCGVNGVGKSTNLAKIANWLIINQIKVLVVACDTFRAGAIEQLKTHVMALKALHEKRGKNSDVKIELFEKGYGRDSAGIAKNAIDYARANEFNCVMVDTAGRMQDNEPLMKELAKLIKVNAPDLTLFVGEALVGNEAVDQLVKFNSALIDNGCQLQDSTRSAINGIVLTKFDTIDDQVGAAISMTHVTSKPIVFVGVGQTYRDLKQLDAKAVTKALMRN